MDITVGILSMVYISDYALYRIDRDLTGHKQQIDWDNVAQTAGMSPTSRKILLVVI